MLTLCCTVTVVQAMPLTGVVRDPQNNGVAATVELHKPKDGTLIYSIQTDDAGGFHFSEVMEMDYTIRLTNMTSWPDQWYSHWGNTLLPLYGTRVDVATISDTLRMSVVATPENNPYTQSITVSLTDSTGTPLTSYSDLYVTIIRRMDYYEFPAKNLSSGATATFDSLQAAEYYISAWSTTFPRQFYDPDRNTSFPKTFLPLNDNANLTQTVRMVDPPAGKAVLNGYCLSETDSRLGNIEVELCQPSDTFRVLYRQVSDANGDFSFINILDTDYYIRLGGNGYPDQWFSQSRSATTLYPDDMLWPMHYAGDTVAIRLAADPIDNPATGSITIVALDSSGKVLSPPGTVDLIDEKTNLSYTPGYDSSISSFVARDIPAGRYAIKLNFIPYPLQYFTFGGPSTTPEYMVYINPNDSMFIEAKVKMNPSQSSSTLTYGFIQGLISDPNGPVAGAMITFLDRAQNVIQSTVSSTDGECSPLRIPAQELFIAVQAAGYPTQFWSPGGMTRSMNTDNAVHVPTADTFYFDAFLQQSPPDNSGDTTSGATTQLSGMVYDKSTGNPLSGVRVVLIDPNQPDEFTARNFWSPWIGYTTSTGHYTLYGIPSGDYRIIAEADSQNYVAQLYPDADFIRNSRIITLSSTSSSTSIDFHLRKGGILTGSVKTTTGKAIVDVRVEIQNSDNSIRFETWSRADGSWKITGIPRGIWHVWVHHEKYIPVDENIKREYDVIEKSTVSVEPFTLEAGGYITGSFSSPVSFHDTGFGNLYWGNCFLYSTTTNDDSKTRWPDFHSGIQFIPDTLTPYDGYFRSDAIKAGTYRICYSPQPQYWEKREATQNKALLPGLGYRFITNGTTSSLPPFFQISTNDSIGNLSLPLRKGFSIFGTLADENGAPLTGNYGVEALVQQDSLLFQISYSTITDDGRFELPGLIDGEEYYFAVWADGYPHQYWSPEGNFANPRTPYRFSAGSYSPLQLKIIRNPSGMDPSQIPGPISLWIENDSLGFPLLRWKSEPALAIDTYTLYSTDRTGTVTPLATLSRSTDAAGELSYRDRRVLSGWRDYVVVGKGNSITVRSNRHGFDLRSKQLTSDNAVWIEAYTTRWGIEMEWGVRNDTGFAATESVTVYKAIGNDPFRLLYRRPAVELHLHDGSWDRRDSGKTYTYYVELPSRKAVSPKISVTLNAAFFAQLSKVLMVGPYDRYQRINDAVAAASDFDQIEVRPGTYKESISLKGKLLTISGNWDYGNPPVIDGGGTVAFTVPVCSRGNEWDRVRITGFIIRNSSTAVKSMNNIEVSECLFDNVSVGLSMTIDSTALLQQITANPFRPNMIDGQVNHCTFIARKSGSLVASATAVGSAEQPGYTGQYSGTETWYIKPAVSLSSRIHISHSNIAFYQSSALQTALPVSLQGTTTRIEFDRCNLWKTASGIRTNGIELFNNNRFLDPQFADSVQWFVSATSPLQGTDWDSWIGYDIRRNNFGDGPNKEIRPSAVSGLVAKPVGLNQIFLKWTALPAVENINRYRIYRLPGDPSLFFINQSSQWEPKISEDQMFSVIDSFSTTATTLIDSTVESGKPYLYVVAAVNNDGIEGEINLPAPPDISAYFVNNYVTQIKLAAGIWKMIGTSGGSDLSLPATTRHALYDWDDKRTPDKTFAQYGRGTQLKAGSGYWFKAAADTVLSMTSASLTALKSVESTIKIRLKKGTTGWNLVSSPFPFSTTPEWLGTFTAWEWNPDSLGYRRANALQPWKAYWVYTARDTALTVWKKQPLSYYQSRPLAKKASVQPLWKIRLSLNSGKSFDTDNFIGAVAPALAKSAIARSPKPPAPFEGARLYIVDNSGSAAGGSAESRQLAQLFKPLSGTTTRLEWLIGINSTDVVSQITVDEIGSLPEHLYAFWVEENRVINLREQQSITVAPNKAETFGYVVITSNPADLALFTGKLTLRSPFPNPFRGAATIEYTLPYTWSNGRSSQESVPVILSIFDIMGNRIVKLIDDHRKPGFYRTIWKGETSSGRQSSAGLYLVKLRYGNNQRFTRLFRVH